VSGSPGANRRERDQEDEEYNDGSQRRDLGRSLLSGIAGQVVMVAGEHVVDLAADPGEVGFLGVSV
jgi:hypothetical protein